MNLALWANESGLCCIFMIVIYLFLKLPLMSRFLFYSLLLLHFVFASCSRTDCPWEKETEEFTEANLRSNVMTGAYKISTGSTDGSISTDSLSKSILYLVADSISALNNRGLLHFVGFPYWENESGINRLGEFYGSWEVQLDKGNILSKNLFVLSPSFYEGDRYPGKSIVMRHDIRMRNGKPLLLIAVLKDFSNDSEFGNSLVYGSAKSMDACNYLIFEKSGEITSVTRSAIVEAIDSLDSGRSLY